MSLRSRIAKLELRAPPLKPKTMLVLVENFKPGPSAPEGAGPCRILMRKPNGEERAVASLREYYKASALPPGYRVQP